MLRMKGAAGAVSSAEALSRLRVGQRIRHKNGTRGVVARIEKSPPPGLAPLVEWRGKHGLNGSPADMLESVA